MLKVVLKCHKFIACPEICFTCHEKKFEHNSAQWFGVPFLEPGDLKQAHWITFLRFAKTTERFQ